MRCEGYNSKVNSYTTKNTKIPATMNTAPKKIRCPSSLIRSQVILNTVIKLLLNFPLIFLVSFRAFLIPEINKYKPNKIAIMGKKINLITPSFFRYVFRFTYLLSEFFLIIY